MLIEENLILERVHIKTKHAYFCKFRQLLRRKFLQYASIPANFRLEFDEIMLKNLHIHFMLAGSSICSVFRDGVSA